MKNAKLIIFTGPSGVGKATIEKHLFENEELKLRLSCSATTRAPREGEVDGKHYYFLTTEEFDQKIEEDAFVEWNAHFSNKYGTLKSEITRIQEEGNTPFLEVEPNGAKNILDKVDRKNVISIFIAPPSISDLRHRLVQRGTETFDEIDERLERVEEEMKQSSIFDHIVVNDQVEKAVSQIVEIIKGDK